MAFDKNEVDRRIRAIALEIFPEFDSDNWRSFPGTNDNLLILGTLEDLFSYYAFTINMDLGVSYNGDIEVAHNKKDRGYGRRLVEAREKICLELGAPLIIVNNNMNSSFWEYMGYNPLPTSFENLVKNLCVSYIPLYKLLSEA